MGFREHYGPWALVAGASQGLGAEFSRQIAARGLNVCMLARGACALEAGAADLRRAYPVEVRPATLDLGAPGIAAQLETLASDLEIGLLVYNAAFSIIAPYLNTSLDDKLRHVDVNVRGPIVLSSVLGARMAARGRGGMIFMTSVSGLHGTELLVSYAASKAFTTALAEGLWQELQPQGIDVVGILSSSIRTPNFLATRPRLSRWMPPPEDPRQVVAAALGALGRGPIVASGWQARMAELFLFRLLSRRLGVRLLSRSTRSLYT